MTHNPTGTSLGHGSQAARLEWLRGALGGMLGLGLAALVSHRLLAGDPALPWLIAPMGASAVLLFAVPASPFSQPWPVFGGHLVSAAIALALHGLAPDPALAAGLAVGAGIAAMSLLGCLHPPAGGTAILMTVSSPAIAAAGWRFLAAPVALNAILLLLGATLFHRLTGHSYPHRTAPVWAPVPAEAHYDPADLEAVLDDWDEVLAVSRDDLDALIRAVLQRGAARES